MSTVAPNPDGYLNHLLPEEAFQFEVARNLCLAVLGAAIWDILVYIPEDIRILRMQKGAQTVNVCFITSRVFSLCYVLLSVIEKTTLVSNCNALIISIGCCAILSALSVTFLFLRRLHAVYANHRWTKRFFSILWFATGSTEITMVIGVRAAHIPRTNYCFDSEVKHYVVVGGFMPLIFDTLVFLAISYKIASTHSIEDSRISWRTLISGKALPRLSRAIILQGGQQYYLLTSLTFVVLVILLSLSSIPPIYRTMFLFPSACLGASMACRVYRNIKLFDYKSDRALPPVSSLRFKIFKTENKPVETQLREGGSRSLGNGTGVGSDAPTADESQLA